MGKHHGGNTKKIVTHNVAYILCNGLTEFNLLELLRTKYKTIYKIKIKRLDTTPSGLVQYAISNSLKDPGVNQVWCLFDTEDETRLPSYDIDDAYARARENGIKMCYCNPQVELFLLSCLEKVNPGIGAGELIPRINKYLKRIKPSLEYDKNDQNLLKTYFIPHLKDGMDRTKADYQKEIKKHRISNDTTPMYKEINTTNIFELIESLKFEKRK